MLSTLRRILCNFRGGVMFLNGYMYILKFSVRWSRTCVKCSRDTLLFMKYVQHFVILIKSMTPEITFFLFLRECWFTMLVIPL